jgi:small conductance mechanosensitive channel
LLVQEAGISLKTYVASATVIGLTVGSGLQGLVQDVITGLTLIFSDTLNVGEVVDLSGQTGRVDRIGLRFTTLITLLEQRVHVPNRNINQISRY